MFWTKDDSHIGVIATFHRVSGCQHCRLCVECADDACLGDTHRLLFHSLVQDAAGTLGHFIELIYAADPTVPRTLR